MSFWARSSHRECGLAARICWSILGVNLKSSMEMFAMLFILVPCSQIISGKIGWLN